MEKLFFLLHILFLNVKHIRQNWVSFLSQKPSQECTTLNEIAKNKTIFRPEYMMLEIWNEDETKMIIAGCLKSTFNPTKYATKRVVWCPEHSSRQVPLNKPSQPGLLGEGWTLWGGSNNSSIHLGQYLWCLSVTFVPSNGISELTAEWYQCNMLCSQLQAAGEILVQTS